MGEIKNIEKFHIFSAVYHGSSVNWKQFAQEGKMEIAFIGRSNVGKSSLTNSLCGNRKLAHVSREPGKTRTINYYDVQSRRTIDGIEERQSWFLVDLPGYGFAKTSGKNAEDWSSFIDDYIMNSPELALICLLIDSRHPDLDIDEKAYAWLGTSGVPVLVIGTKGDKLKASEKQQNRRKLASNYPSVYPPVIYSSLKGTGKGEVLHIIESIVCR